MFCNAQAPTAPDIVFELLMELFGKFDQDAVQKDSEGNLLPSSKMPGVVLKELDSVPESDFKELLALPYQDMYVVLFKALKTDEVLRHVGLVMGECSKSFICCTFNLRCFVRRR